MLVICAKNDLPNSMMCRDAILKLDLVSIVDREVACYSISAKCKTNIDLVYNWITEQTELFRKNLF